MKKQLSIIIPARNEEYLQATINDLLENMETDIEIIVGLDNYWPYPPLEDNPKVCVYHSPDRIGMRPMINRLAQIAQGKYLMKTDAHCAFDSGYDRKLINIMKPGYTVLGIRYELDVKKWERKNRTNCDFRYLSHPDIDKLGGLRGLPWHEYKKRTKGKKIAESMSLSGSGWLMEKSQWDAWGGLDENHGTFGQEGCEIACKTWLQGGKLLINRETWYAHWNRGKAPYSLGRRQRDKSVDYSIDYWMNDQWPLQKYSFGWLIEHFDPVPGWPTKKNLEENSLKPIKARRQGTLFKGTNQLDVDELWDKRLAISEPLKRWRLKLFFDYLFELYGELKEGKKYTKQEMRQTKYYYYLGTHLQKQFLPEKMSSLMRKWQGHLDRKFKDSVNLFYSMRKNGLFRPLEFYNDNGHMYLWKGYRRLVALKSLGYKTVPGLVHLHKGLKILPAHFPPKVKSNSIDEIGQSQFIKYGWKATDKYWVHGYTQVYDKLFDDLRLKKIKILEFGALRGASLRMWHDAFPKAWVYGVDKNKTRHKEFTQGLKRIKVFIGRQENINFINKIKKHGPFDIIIDDCSHDPNFQWNLFKEMWESVAKAGYYIIEDTYRSYLPKYEKERNIPREFSSWVDAIYTNQEVLSVQLFYNMCVVRKGI